MACFAAPTAAAIIVTAAKKKIPSRFHIEWLLTLLWGGVAWLIPEHIFHGEVVFYPPFFTAGFQEIISEIVSVGIPMVMAVTAFWLVMLLISTFYQKFRMHFVPLIVVGAVIMILVDKTF